MKKLLTLAIGLSVFLIASQAGATFYLHGTGPNANPPTLFLNNTSPTATTAKYRDSTSVNFSGGNLWKEIGTWTITTTGTLTELNNLRVWLGLKNSDDIGTRFDLRAEVYRNGQFLITSGELYCIQGITRNPDLAKEVVVSFGSFSPVDFYGADMLSLKILTRIGTNGAGTFCGGHSNAVGLRLYFDAVSRPSRFDATLSENSSPVANAGQDLQVRVGDLVTLDGRNSYDPDGNLITYRWTITTAPSGSSASLSNPSSVMPTFVPDIPGDYIIVLTVNDGQVDSSPDDVVVIAAQPNVAPTAIAGPDQSVVTGSQVFLDGRGSFDPDGDPLTYRWQMISLPAESTAFLDNPASPTPSFLADKNGQYIIVLTVNDGELDSLPDDVVVISATPNAPPVAYAGDDQIVSRNTMISLNGTASYDPDNNPLAYIWSIVSSPEGSTSQFDDPASPTPKIFADREGEYVFRLVVYDGQLYSNPDTVVIQTVNNPPIADAGPDKSGVVGVPVNLNGSGSSDPNGDTLTYQWSVGSAPSGSTATISNPTSVTPSFTPDLPGTYTIQLVVNDGQVNSNPDTVIISATIPNRDPVANPGGPYSGVVGIPVQFNGSGSSDPDGDPITYNWQFGDGGTDSAVNPTHTYASTGTYNVTLRVEDNRGGSNTAQTTAQIAAPGPSITGFNPTEGSVGTTVTISGSRFNVGGLRGNLGGAPGIISRFTDSSITTTVPLGAMTGPITVTTLEGTATSALNFTVKSPYDFNLSVTPQNGKAAPGGQITYTVSVTGSEGFSNLVGLTIQGLPEGFSSYFSPKTITSGQTSTLFITVCDCSISPLNLTITGSSTIEGQTVTRSASISLEVLTPGITTLVGRVLDTDKWPIKNVTIRVGDSTRTTDESGNFVLENPPIGDQVVLIDGSTASAETAKYPTIPITMNIAPNQTNSLPYVPHLHAQKNYNFTPINPSVETIAEDPEIPDFQLRIPAGVDIIGWDGNPNTKVSIRKVPIDALPVPPPPPGVQGRTVYMFYFGKIGGGVPTTPIPVTVPNDLGLQPGEKAELWYFNESPNINEAPNEWSMAGLGTVSEDGKTISTDPGVGIPRFCCGAILWSPIGQTGTNVRPDGVKGGEPVDLATGVFVHSETDLAIRGRIPIIIKRDYRTLDAFRGPYGIGTYFSYDWYLFRSGNMATLVIPPGTRVSFTRRPDGSFINNDEPMYRGTRVTFNPDGTSTLRMKDGMTYKFDVYGLLVEQKDRNGNKLRFLREYEGNVTKIVGPDGRTMVTFSLYILGRDVIKEMTDITGRTVTYTYDISYYQGTRTGLLKSVTNPEGGITQYQYDSQGRMTAIIDPRGNTTVRNIYDLNSRICRQEQADGGIWKFYYITADRATTPENLKLLSEAESGGPITQTECSARLSSSPVVATIVVDPRGNPTTYHFNGRGFLLSVTNALGRTRRFERDGATNLLISQTDALARKTKYTYDDRGNVSSITDHAQNTVRFEYEPTYNGLTKITDPLERLIRFEYDPTGNMTKIIDPMGRETTIAYDGYGQPISVTNPLGKITRLEYDEHGNLSATIDPLGNKLTAKYDAISRLISITNPLERETTYTHDAVDNIKEILGAMNNVTKIEYDAHSNLAKLTDANSHETVFNHDPMNRLNRRIDQLGNPEDFIYDPLGNLVRFIDRKNQSTTLTYNPLNRIIRSDYADGNYTIFDYDAGGRLIRIHDSVSGPIEYEYDEISGCIGCQGPFRERIKRQTTPQGTIEYQYDAIGRRISMRASAQDPIEYRYNDNNQLTQLIHPTLGTFLVDYDEAGRRKSLTFPNGIITNYTYDDAGRLLSTNYAKESTQIDAITYSYDADYKRTTFDRTNSQTLLPEPTTATYNDANQMLTFKDKSFTYDKNGNLTSMTGGTGTTLYTWDARNRLVAIDGPTMTARFKYDALNRRVEKTINGRTTQYIYDGTNITAQVEDGLITATYARSLNIDEVFARVDGNSVRYYLLDALRNTVALTDETGTITTSYTYDPFGNTATTGEPNDNPFQFTGRENDGTRLYYYRARYYSPDLHRFISEDPIIRLSLLFSARPFLKLLLTDPDIFKNYSYVANNPANFVDPYGLMIGHMVHGALHGTFSSGGTGELIGGIAGGIAGGALAGPWGIVPGIIVGETIGSFFDPPYAGQLNPDEDWMDALEKLRAVNKELEEFLNSPEMQEFRRLVEEWNRRTGGIVNGKLCQ